MATSIFGQEVAQPMLLGESMVIDSEVLTESRRVFIATPSSYEQNDGQYGVVYVLDGDTQFNHVVSSAEFLAGFANQSIPPLVVVGIGNTNRVRDMTPPSEAPQNQFLQQGGADQFLEFIVDELTPWVDERYRTTDYKVLVGHSLGGLFAVHSLISESDAFDSVLVIDPSLSWNSQETAQQASEFVAANAGLSTSLYLAVSDIGAPDFSGTQRLIEVLSANAPRSLRWHFAEFTGESHDSVPLPAVFRGLRWIFADWDVEDRAEGEFSSAPAEEIFENIDEIYRQSGQQFGLERETPYLVFESLLGYLAENSRVDEAAALTLRHSDRYPLPLVPNVIAGIAQLLAEGGDQDAAIDYLNAVLEIYPGNETAQDALVGMGVDPLAE